MIRLHRPPEPPNLAARKAEDTATLWQALEDKRVLKFRRQTYAHVTVKTALRNAQGRKCAYCETHLPRSHGVVEHFRPKSGWQQARRTKLHTPGYFWLAYEWSNLLFACDVCNDAAHKGNLFPLAPNSPRASAIVPNVAVEHPMLLNPYIPDHDPEQHIAWHRDVPKARNGSERGWATIKGLGLDGDTELADWRRGYLDDLEDKLLAVEEGNLSPARHTRFLAQLKRAVESDAPYLAMVRSNFGERIQNL